MSWEPLTCSTCQREAAFERIGSMGTPDTFAVSWQCPGCDARLVDVVPVGVLVPVSGCCLNCGSQVDEAGECQACGVPRPPLVVAIHAACGDPPSVEAAQQLGARGLVRLGLNALDLRLETQPDDREAWLAKARVLNSVGLGFHGAPALERALALGADTSHNVALGIALASGAQHKSATAAFEAYLVTHPKGPHLGFVLVRQARALEQMGRVQEAEACLRRALSSDPGEVQAQVDLYVLLHRQRRFADALESLELALPQLDPADRIGLLPGRAELLCELMRGEEALTTIEEVLTHGPDNPRVVYTHGRALAMTGQLERAKVAMARVVALEPDNGPAQRALAQISAALTTH